jgi:hypothetical protein
MTSTGGPSAGTLQVRGVSTAALQCSAEVVDCVDADITRPTSSSMTDTFARRLIT